MHRGLVKGCFATVLALLWACADRPVEVLQTGPPTYHEDVTPLLARSCWCCHQAGGSAYDLTERGQVEEDLEAIVEAMQDGTMPPARPPPEGCVALDEPVASADDLEVIRAWDEGGRLPGDPALAATVPAPCRVLEGPVRRFSNGGYTFTGARGFESRCFVLDATFGEDQFLVGAHFDPGGSSVSWVLLQTAPAGSAAGESFPCETGSPLVPRQILAFSTPRSSDLIYPSGSGSLVEAGTTLMLRVRYDMAVGEEPLPAHVETAVSIAVARTVERPGDLTVVFDEQSLPPGLEAAEAESVFGLRSGARLHEVAVSMHGRGRSARLELERDGESRCLLDVPSWDPGSTRLFRLARPLEAGSGTSRGTLRLRCVYDTTGDGEPVEWGDPPSGEVCLGLVLTTLP